MELCSSRSGQARQASNKNSVGTGAKILFSPFVIDAVVGIIGSPKQQHGGFLDS
jgi:hypothetical protein